MVKRLIYFLAVSIFVISCSKNPNSPLVSQTNQNHQLFPMAIGNSWTYKKSNLDLTGNVTSTINVTLNIPRDTTIASETWYFYAYHGTIFWTTRTDGIWRWAFVAGQPSFPTLFLKYPTSIGDTITDTSSIYSKYITVTISLDSLKATPSGTYHCILYRQSYFWNDTLQSEDYLYYSVGVGWVATDAYAVDSLGRHKTYRNELISCLIK